MTARAPATARGAVARSMSERELQDAVIAMAKAYSWRCCHFRPAQTAKGWRTALQGDVGFPDLVCLRKGRLLALELKSSKGKATAEQLAWMEDFAAVEGCEAYVLHPEHWLNGRVEDLLR